MKTPPRSPGSLSVLLLTLLIQLATSTAVPAAPVTLVATNSAWRFARGTNEASLPDTTFWRMPEFADGGWVAGNAPFFYGEAVAGGTALPDMAQAYPTLFLRRTFQIPDPAALGVLTLHGVIDDGLIAWVNGHEIARYNVPDGELKASQTALTSVPEPHVWQTFVTNAASLLPGVNVLTVQLFNSSLTSSDILFDAELLASANDDPPPVVQTVLPLPGDVARLTEVTVTFSEPVRGVVASALLFNGVPANSVTGEGATWTYQLSQPPPGPVHVAWIPNHGITDFGTPANRLNEAGQGASWDYGVLDPDAPRISLRLPPSGAVVRHLPQVEVNFSEVVDGISAASLLINGKPASSVAGVGAGPYVFWFPEVDSGNVEFRWAADHVIRDASSVRFEGAPWSVKVDPSAAIPAVRINEFLAINSSGLKDELGETEAWIELYNGGQSTINLEGWGLTDDSDSPDQWVFPAVSLAPGGYLIVFASGRDVRDPGQRLHTNFKLARGGEYLGLFDNGSPRLPVSELRPKYPQQRNNHSYGLNPSGQWRYFATPTPGAANGDSSIVEACEPVHFSVGRGFFARAPFDVTLSTPTPGARILYTTNGSEPGGTNGLVYTNAIRVDRITTLRAVAEREGLIPSPVATHTYLYDISAGRRTLPAVSLVTATNHLTGPTGIVGIKDPTYRNTLKRGIAWERPVSMEYLFASGERGFQEDAGLRLQASDYLRPILSPSDKFSWRVYFRSDYGPGRLRYPIIPISSVDENDVVVLRAGHNDDLNPFIKDELARRLFADAGQVSSLGSHCLVYVNGKLMPNGGYYNAVERIEADFLQLHHGGSDKWDVLSQGATVLDGNNRDFLSMMSLVTTKSMTNPANYLAMAARLDLTNFVDYLLVNAYAFNGDWPHNNWRAARERVAGRPWRFYVWDAEFGFGTGGRSVTGNTFTEDLGGSTEIPTLHQRLLRSPEYKLLFFDRIQRHFFNTGALSPTNVTRRFNELRAELAGVIPSMDRYIVTTWVPQRPKSIFSHFRQLGVWSSNAPAFRQHGGTVQPGFVLTITNQTGEIYYTRDGSDPRLPFSGEVASGAVLYDPAAPPVIDQSGVVIARSRSTGTWTGATVAEFRVAEIGWPLRITEVMYNPPGGSAYEFVEIANRSDRSLTVGGVGFSGIDFVFPVGTTMPPRAVWVVASDSNPAQFLKRYPNLTVAGWFSGGLDNGGERLGLNDPAGNPIESVDYHDGGGWPVRADGDGSSLERVLPDGDPDEPSAWVASAVSGGSPGSFVPRVGPPSAERIRELYAAGTDAIPDHAIIGRDTGPYSVEGVRFSLAGRDESYLVTNSPPAGVGPVEKVWFDGVPSKDGRHASYRLPREGGTLIAERISDGVVTWRDLFSYGPQADGYVLRRGFSAAGQEEFHLLRLGAESEGAVPLAPSSAVAINEFLANALPGDDDWIELHNRDGVRPVALQGFAISVSNRLHRVTLPTFIAPGGYLRLRADERPGPDHLDLRLPAAWGTIRLISPDGLVADEVAYVNAAEGVSRGRFPDGGSEFASFPVPTPGASNTVLPADGPFVNEILARPVTGPTWLEFHNPRSTSVDVGGWAVILRSTASVVWRFPQGTTLAAGAAVRVWADPLRAPTVGITLPAGTTNLVDRFNLGVALPDLGAVIQFATAAGVVVDSANYGPQVPGRSIGRAAGGWALLDVPTPNAVNSAASPLGAAADVALNEWGFGGNQRSSFVELYNNGEQPVSIGSFRLTDDPSLPGINRFLIPPMSFVGGKSWVAFASNPSKFSWDQSPELPFEISAAGETVRLYDVASNIVDAVTVGSGTAGASAGRLPDGRGGIVGFAVSSPGAANLADSDGDGIPDSWEMANGMDPKDAGDAIGDPDGDGMSNRDEFSAGTDPRDARSLLNLNVARGAPGLVVVAFEALAGHSYRIEASDDGGSTWLEAAPPVPAGAVKDVIRIELEIGNLAAGARLLRVSTPR